jgi:DNA primase
LVTESILDSLAGDIYFGRPSLSLCALNGIPNVKWLERIVDTYSPCKMLLALDNDSAGKEATEKAKEILKGKKVKIEMVKDHIKAGVKDLHKLLIAESPAKKKKEQSPFLPYHRGTFVVQPNK